MAPEPTPNGDDGDEVGLAREMTLLDATMLGLGAMLGGGIFVLLGVASGIAGPALLLALFLNGFVTLPTLFVYAELGSASNDQGGGYSWAKDGLGQPFGFLGGWLGWFAHAVACSLYALAASAFAVFIASSAGWVTATPQLVQAGAIGLAALFVGFNYLGVKVGARTENVVLFAVLAVVVVFVGVGLYEVGQHPETVRFNLAPFFPAGATTLGVSAVVLAMGLTFIGFQGYEIIAQTSEEIQNPKRNIPRAIGFSFLLAWAIMLLVALVAFGLTTAAEGAQSWQFLSNEGVYAVAAAAQQFLPYGGVLIAGAALVMQLNALDAGIYSSSRVAFAMGRDGNLPRFFGRIHARRRTPHLAVLGAGALILGMAMLPLITVAVTADVLFLLLFLLVNLAYIKLRKTLPQEQFGFRAPLFPYLPLAGVLVKAFLAVYLFRYSPTAWGIAIAWILAGLVFYYSVIRPREHLEPEVEARPAFAARPTDRVRKSYRILVLLTSPAPSTARNLARVAGDIAKSLDGEVLVLYPVTVPDVTPLEEGKSLFKGSNLITEARRAMSLGIPVHTLVRIGHNLDATVRQVVREEGVSLLLMSSVSKVTVGQPISELVAYPPCDIGLLRYREDVGANKVLIPAHGGSHVPLAIRLGTALAKAYNGTATLYHVRTKDEPEPLESRKVWASITLEHNRVPDTKTDLDVVEDDNVVRAVAEKAKGHDLVIVGASMPRLWSKGLVGPSTQEISDKVAGNVLIVRSSSGRTMGPPAIGRRLLLLRRYFLPE